MDKLASSAEKRAIDLICHAPLRTVCVSGPLVKIMSEELPEELSNYPSMMSDDEKKLLYGLARYYYSGAGVIIDAGIFLGASSRCFAKGYEDNATGSLNNCCSEKPIVSYDMAIVNPGMPGFCERNGVDLGASVGESFEAYLRTQLQDVARLVDLQVGDIVKSHTHNRKPIEILFLDVLKLPDISRQIIPDFFSRLIPGRSIVVQQDYFNELLEHIKAHQEVFDQYFTYLGEVQSSAIFLCKQKIARDVAEEMIDSIDGVMQERCSTIAMQRTIDPARRFMMAASKSRVVARVRGRDEALAYLKNVENDYPAEVIGGQKYKRRLGEILTNAAAFAARFDR